MIKFKIFYMYNIIMFVHVYNICVQDLCSCSCINHFEFLSELSRQLHLLLVITSLQFTINLGWVMNILNVFTSEFHVLLLNYHKFMNL